MTACLKRAHRVQSFFKINKQSINKFSFMSHGPKDNVFVINVSNEIWSERHVFIMRFQKVFKFSRVGVISGLYDALHLQAKIHGKQFTGKSIKVVCVFWG